MGVNPVTNDDAADPRFEGMPRDEFNRASQTSAANIEEPRHKERAAVLGMLIARHLSLPEDRIGCELPLNRLGLDSLGLLNLTAAIDLELGVYVSPESFADGMSLSRLAELVAFGPAQATSAPVCVSAKLHRDDRVEYVYDLPQVDYAEHADMVHRYLVAA